MRLLILAATFVLSAYCSFAQTVVLSDDFETGGAGWTTFGTTSPNDWRLATCAGNGSTLPGSNAQYISKGGAIPGCGATGIDQFAYDNASSGSNSIIRYIQVDATCYSNLNYETDILVDGDASDFAEVVVSSDAATWTSIDGPFFDLPTWGTSAGSIPGSFDGTIFFIGIRFTYNDVTVDGAPVAFDNFSVLGSDDTAPAVFCPANQTIYASTLTCDASMLDYESAIVVSDLCDDTTVVYMQSIAAGSPLAVSGTPYLVTITVTDQSSNSNQCQFNVTVIDTVSPTITCPGNATEYLTSSCDLTVPDFTGSAIPTDNCLGVTLTQAPPSGSTISASTAVTITATDASGNTGFCSFNLAAIDTISPAIACPATTTVGTTSTCTYTMGDFTTSVVTSDNCTFTGSLVLSQSPVVGSTLNTGANTITLYSTDASSNEGACTFTLVVEDQTPPTIASCVPNQTVVGNANCEGTLGDYTGLLNAFDNCSATMNLVVSQSPTSGTLISGTTTVTITVADENGNATNCQFPVFVSDTINPVPTCPGDFTTTINSSCDYTIPDLTGGVTGTDNCSSFGNMVVSQNPVAGSAQNGITVVTLILTDEQGNFGSCTTTITPIDTVVPTITCPSPAPINNGSACDFNLGYYGGQAFVLDNCSDYTITQTPSIGTLVQVGATTITLEVTDAGGNSSSCSFDLMVLENVTPTISCPGNISSCDPVITYSDPTFSDNCLVSISQTDLTGFSSGSTFPVGTTALEYTAVDSSGNANMCSFNVEILAYDDDAVIGEDTIYLCNQSSALLSADPILSGTGEWTVSSGTGAFNNQFANSTGVNGIGIGTNVYVWTVSSPSCGSNSDSLVVINVQSDLPASTQDTILACLNPTVPLQGNTPLFGNGIWTTNSAAAINSPTSANTTATLTENGWHEFVWTISNAGCPSTSDTLRVFSMRAPEINQSDTSLCLNELPINLSVSNLAEGQSVSWFSENNSVSITPNNTASTQASGFNTEASNVICTFTYSGCPSTYDTISITGIACEAFDPLIPTVITPANLDGKNDVFQIDLLDALYPECHVVIFNRWGTIVYESTGYNQPWNGTYQEQFLPMGTYFYRIELNDSENRVLTGDISIIN